MEAMVWWRKREEARRELLLKELAGEMAGLVAAGEMTEAEANEWLARKAEAWKEGVL